MQDLLYFFFFFFAYDLAKFTNGESGWFVSLTEMPFLRLETYRVQ